MKKSSVYFGLAVVVLALEIVVKIPDLNTAFWGLVILYSIERNEEKR